MPCTYISYVKFHDPSTGCFDGTVTGFQTNNNGNI